MESQSQMEDSKKGATIEIQARDAVSAKVVEPTEAGDDTAPRLRVEAQGPASIQVKNGATPMSTNTGALDHTIPEDAGQATQVVAMYPWDKFRPSRVCFCFSFVVQLVLMAAMGSFLFGFNVGLLNTALDAVASDFQLCGSLPPSALVAKQSTKPLEVCDAIPECREECGVFKNPGDAHISAIRCKSGYAYLKCESLKWQKAFITCAVLIGGAVGAMTGGRFMDRGRRLLLILDMVIFATGVISSVCANSFSAIFWARLIVGYGVGVASVASPTYMAEVTPPAKRGKYGVFHQVFITVGILLPMLLGLALVNPNEQPYDWEPPAFQRFWWRFMLGLGIIPVIIALYFFIAVYTFETPVWYVEQRRYRDAAEVLRRIYEKDDVSRELQSIIENVRLGEEYRKKGLSFFSALSNAEYRWVIFVGLGLSGFQQFGGINVFITSSSDLFKKAGLNGTMQIAMSIIMASINVLMTFPTIFLIDRVGRKSLLLTGSALQTIFVIPAAVSYWTESTPDDPTDRTKILAIVAVLGFVTFFAIAFGPVVWVYLFEIYPMEIKDIAAGVATAFNWLAGIVMVFVAIVIPNQVSFTLFAALQFAGTLFVLFFMRETKGRVLGESPFMDKKEGAEVPSGPAVV